MKRSVKTLMLVCLLTVLCGGYFLVSHMDNSSAVQEEKGSFALTAHTAEEVAGLQWNYEEYAWDLVLQDGTWYRADSASFPLNQTLVESMAETVGGLTATRRLESVETPADYGLDEAAFRLQVTWTDGTATTFILGDATPFNDGYYVQTSDEQDVLYIVASNLQTGFQKTEADLAVFDVLPEVENATQLSIASVLDVVLQETTQELDGDAHWYTVDGKLLSTNLVSDLVDTVTSLSWEELVEADASDDMLVQMQLTEDTAVAVTVFSGDEPALSLYLGAVEESSGNYYARLADSHRVYTVDSSAVFAILSANADDLRPTTLLTESLNDMACVSYTAQNTSWVSEPQEVEEVEDAESDNDAQTYTEADQSIWSVLTALSMNGYVSEEQPGSLLLTVEIEAANGNTSVLTISECSIDSYYLTMTGRDDMLVDADTVDKLLRTLRSIQE